MTKSREVKNFNPDAFLFDASSICWEHIVGKTVDVIYSVCEWMNLFSLKIEKHAQWRFYREPKGPGPPPEFFLAPSLAPPPF